MENEERIRNGYKAIFSSELGQLVLEDMLDELNFVWPCETPEQTARCNYAKELLLKIYGPMEGSKLRNLIKRLLRRTKC